MSTIRLISEVKPDFPCWLFEPPGGHIFSWRFYTEPAHDYGLKTKWAKLKPEAADAPNSSPAATEGTPRTEAMTFLAVPELANGEKEECVSAFDAKQLERELNDAKDCLLDFTSFNLKDQPTKDRIYARAFKILHTK